MNKTNPIMEDNSTYKQKQNGAIQALSHESTQAGNSSFLDKVISIIRNVFIKYRPQTQVAMVPETEGLYHLSAGAEYTVPEDSYSAAAVSETINSFNESCRTAFTMYLAGYKYKEIARSMRLPLSTVKNRISQSRRQLQSSMAAY